MSLDKIHIILPLLLFDEKAKKVSHRMEKGFAQNDTVGKLQNQDFYSNVLILGSREHSISMCLSPKQLIWEGNIILPYCY